MKSTENNGRLIIRFRKPSKKQTESEDHHLKEIAIDPIDGPYIQDREWCIDVRYWHHEDTVYAVPLKHLLNDGFIKLHDIILEHGLNWSRDFVQWFRDRSSVENILYQRNDVIFDDDKYIMISYTAPQRSLYNIYWSNDYKKSLYLYGGNSIDIHQSISQNKIIFDDSNTMYYCSNDCELVVADCECVASKLLKVSLHSQQQHMLKNIVLNLKNIQKYHLRYNYYGKDHCIKIPICNGSFYPFILNVLTKERIVFTVSKVKLYFTTDHQLAEHLFPASFSKYFNNTKVYCSEIEWSYMFESEILNVSYGVLQQEYVNGVAFGPPLGYDIL